MGLPLVGHLRYLNIPICDLPGKIIDLDKPSTNSSSPVTPGSMEPISIAPQPKSSFSIFPVFDVPPAASEPVVTYSKGVQTTDLWSDDGDEVVYKGEDLELLRKSIRQEVEEEMTRTQRRKRESDITNYGGDKEHLKISIAEEGEVDQLSINEKFDKFLDQSFKVVGRALDNPYDITVDYALKTENNKQTSDTPVIEIAQFFSQHSVGRAVTDLDWSPKFPELIATSHTAKRGDLNAPKGLVQIWNLHASRSLPEYIFTSSSDVLSVRFSSFEPNLIFGTSYNGQIVTWDMRSRGDPILSSPMNGNGHSHPVYSIEMTGTQNAHNLVTASTDGVVCTWTPDLLEKPQDKLTLIAPTATRNDDLAPTKLAISPRDSSRFVVGTEEGVIYQCSRFGQAGSRAGVDPRGSYRGHAAPITSLDFHSSKGVIDFSDLLLSSSLDWSVKLWKIRQFTGPIGSAAPVSNAYGGLTGTGTIQTTQHPDLNNLEPLLDLVREYEVYDVAWSNFHPAVFADVDGSGHLEIWDLTKDLEIPVTRIKPSSSSSPYSPTTAFSSSINGGGAAAGSSGNGNTTSTAVAADAYLSRPLNRVSWERVTDNAARKVAVGGLDGVVTVFELDSEYFGAPKQQDWVQLEKSISRLDASI